MMPQEQRSVSEVDRIRDQFRRAFEGEAWHGPAVLALLDGVTAEQAAAHPISGAHSIWELTLHIAAWERACLRRLNNDPAQLSDAEDWEPVNDTSEAAWEATKRGLIDNHRELLEAIASVDDARLNEPIMTHPEIPFSSVYVTLHGGVQHDLYHAGQIAMLKKALENL
ncbi:MAG TPA: DinB family protein [Pyrinomonadaceae bacterium]|nr:DinB family protein [Pyrinomonadaceae bacterium]